MDLAQTSRDIEIDWAATCAFHPKQQEAARAMYTHRYLLYGGARGGGKSRFLRWALVELLVDAYHTYGVTGAHSMLACETYPDLRDRQISKIKLEMPEWLGTLADTQADGLCFKLHETFGGGVLCLRNLDDPTKYQSAEFAHIGVDELTKQQKDTFDILRGSLRWPGINHTVFMGATNPGNAGHAWVKALWIDRIFPPELRPRANEFIFVQALPKDNPSLDQTYWDELNSLPENLRRAWVEGDWNVFSGMAFPGWSEDNIIDPFDIPAHWPRRVGIDWGFAKPFAAIGTATDPDSGRVYAYRECYGPGLTDQQQARTVRETFAGENVLAYYADPSMWAKKTQTLITSTADIYEQEKVHLTPADNDRLQGKRKLDRMLMTLPDGRPGLQVFRTCRNLLRTFPLLAYDAHNSEDIDTEQEDHAYDALRYSQTNTINPRSRSREQRRPSGWMAVRGI